MTSTGRRLIAAAAIALAGGALIAAGLRAQGAAVTRGPYLQLGTASSVIVRWRTAAPADSVVRYGSRPDALTAVASVPGSRTEHVVTLTGLEPHTRYFYAVGTSSSTLAGGDLDHAFATSPPTGARAPVRIWALGDAGTADATARAVRDAYQAREFTSGTQLVLMLGDNAYPAGTDAQYQAAVFDTFGAMLRRAVLWPTFGNHDAISSDAASGTGPYFDAFSLPAGGEAGGVPSGTEAYYSFDYANVHVVCLDSSESDRSPSGAMAAWLRADLAASDAEWTIAFFHHAPYSKGTHDSDVDVGMREMRESIVPMLEAGGVDLVLAGHSHTYERSMFIAGHYGPASTFSPAHVVDGSDGAYGYQKVRGAAAGAVYALSGSAGASGPGPLDHPAMRAAMANSGSLAIDIDGGRLRAFYVRDSGAIQDAFTILKQLPDGPPAAPWGLKTQEFFEPWYLSWAAPDRGGRVDGYRIEAGSAPGLSDVGVLTIGPQPVVPIGGVNGRWFVRVRAFNASGVSPPSEEIVIAVDGWNHQIQPPPPSGLVTAAVNGSFVQLSWPAGGFGDVSTWLEIGSRPGRADLGVVLGQYPMQGIVSDGVYYVRFRRRNLGGTSAPSLDTQVVVGTVAAPPDRPGVVRAAVTGATVAMTWAPPAGTAPLDHYVVEAGLSPRTTAVQLATPDARPGLVVHGVPPGTYYVRVRAANAAGDGVTSADARVVVP